MCARERVCVAATGTEKWTLQMEEYGKLRRSKVSSSGEKPQTIVLLWGTPPEEVAGKNDRTLESSERSDRKQMWCQSHHSSAQSHHCALKPEQRWFLSAADSAAAAESFTPAVQKQRGVQTLIDSVLLTHTIPLSWTLVPFSFLAGLLYSVSRRCPPHPDVRLETLP